MKKIAKWVAAICITIFGITWAIIGLKILDNNYIFVKEAYVGLFSLMGFFLCLLFIKSTNRCPHCGKMNASFGKYCPYCGKEIK